MFGWTAADIVGQNLDRLLPEVHSPRPADAAPFRGGESTGRAGTAREVVALRVDGTTFPASVYVKRVDRGKQPPMFCNVFRDLTEGAGGEQAMLRHATQVEQATGELAQAKFEAGDARAEAEAANRSKSDFLANMSHEIRTPMTAILGFAETLQDPSLEDAERREAVDTILRNGGYLMRLINHIPDPSKIEAGGRASARPPPSPRRPGAAAASP